MACRSEFHEKIKQLDFISGDENNRHDEKHEFQQA